jgi:hypothetical protein
MEEVFESASQSAGSLAGVFEFDGETGYFYLYETKAPDGAKIVGSIHILEGDLDLSRMTISVRWDRQEQRVGLFIDGRLWAAFDSVTGNKFGGDYRPNATPDISPDIAAGFR